MFHHPKERVVLNRYWKSASADVTFLSLIHRLFRMLKCELTVNKEEGNDPARTQQQQQDRLGLLRSILLSSMTIPNDDDKDESQSTVNKENQL